MRSIQAVAVGAGYFRFGAHWSVHGNDRRLFHYRSAGSLAQTVSSELGGDRELLLAFLARTVCHTNLPRGEYTQVW